MTAPFPIPRVCRVRAAHPSVQRNAIDRVDRRRATVGRAVDRRVVGAHRAGLRGRGGRGWCDGSCRGGCAAAGPGPAALWVLFWIAVAAAAIGLAFARRPIRHRGHVVVVLALLSVVATSAVEVNVCHGYRPTPRGCHGASGRQRGRHRRHVAARSAGHRTGRDADVGGVTQPARHAGRWADRPRRHPRPGVGLSRPPGLGLPAARLPRVPWAAVACVGAGARTTWRTGGLVSRRSPRGGDGPLRRGT